MAHPECRPEVVDLADAVLSTSQMLAFAAHEPGRRVHRRHRGRAAARAAQGRARQAVLRAVAPDALPQHEAHHAREGPRLPRPAVRSGDGGRRDVRERALARRRADGRDWLTACRRHRRIGAGGRLPGLLRRGPAYLLRRSTPTTARDARVRRAGRRQRHRRADRGARGIDDAHGRARHQGPPDRDQHLVRAGRHRRRGGRGRQRRAAPRRHARRRPGPVRRGRRARGRRRGARGACRAPRATACTSTSPRGARSRSLARAGTRCRACCTRATRPALRSSARSPTRCARASASRCSSSASSSTCSPKATGASARSCSTPATGTREVFWADAVVLATGGAGQVYRVTTNPAIATGDGLAAAWRAGAEVADLEFVQFHPTALDHDAAPRFLITEALRGEGAYLLDCDGERFMLGVHPLAELAPRDVVSREIERSWRAAGATTSGSTRGISARSTCAAGSRRSGRRARRPATTCHATCCRSRPPRTTSSAACASTSTAARSVPGLYASGEVTASGLHGANRLASNSLLEGLGLLPANRARARESSATPPSAGASRGRPRGGPAPGPGRAARPLVVSAAIKDVMQRHVGMSRSDEGLARAAADARRRSARPTWRPAIRRPNSRSRTWSTVGTLIAHAAWLRTESRGCHFRRDFPERDDEHWRVRIVQQRGEAPVRIGVEGHTMRWAAQVGRSASSRRRRSRPHRPRPSRERPSVFASPDSSRHHRPRARRGPRRCAGALRPERPRRSRPARARRHELLGDRPRRAASRERIVARQACVVAGLPVVAEVYDALSAAAGLVDPVEVFPLVAEGARVRGGTAVAEVEGVAAAVLAGERTALDFLMQLSGIATQTARVGRGGAGPLRRLRHAKDAAGAPRTREVRGRAWAAASNHRVGLYDMVLVKDNHIRRAGGIAAAVAEGARRSAGPARRGRGRLARPGDRSGRRRERTWCCSTTSTTRPSTSAVAAVREAARRGRPRRCCIEASGGMTLSRARALAGLGSRPGEHECAHHGRAGRRLRARREQPGGGVGVVSFLQSIRRVGALGARDLGLPHRVRRHRAREPLHRGQLHPGRRPHGRGRVHGRHRSRGTGSTPS